MTVRRNPAKDQVAIVSAAGTAYSRSTDERSAASLAVEAGQSALRAAGVGVDEIDGVCGSVVPTKRMQAMLGIPEATWWVDSSPPFGLHMVEAANAVYSGSCTTALVYHANYRGPNASRSAAKDPFRRRNSGLDSHAGERRPEEATGPTGYAGWAARYLQEYGVGREVFGRIAINSRTNAMANPRAVFREPLTMEDYLSARMIREPQCLFDMDVPVDGADAFVLTTAERARDLCERPVLIHAATFGRTRHPFADQQPGYLETGKEIVAESLWSRSDLGLQDIDVLEAYDGFSNIAVSWIESLGYCRPGDASEFLAESWSDVENRLLLAGRVPVNTHGGSLSEGGTQGTGHVREAVEQLQATAGDRQVTDARAALVATGGFLWNATGMILRADG